MFFSQYKNRYLNFIICLILLAVIFPKINFAKISDKNAIRTFWQEAPIMPGAAKYFIRTEKIEKKTKVLNNHPININSDVLRRMLKQLSYKYDRNEPEIPLFSNKELILLSDYVPKALKSAKSNEDVTFVVKGPHSSARWSFKEDRLTAGRLFIANNKLNLILGAVQVGLQPTLDEQYQGNVWETARVVYDIGHRNKQTKYDGLIVVFNQNTNGIFRKSNDRKDWFVFTNTAYKQAKDNIDSNKISKEKYQTLQQQIDSLQKKIDRPSNNNQQKRRVSPPTSRKQIQRKQQPVVTEKQNSEKDNARVLEQRLKTIESLYNKGMLSEEEYNRKRNEILKGI